MVSQWVVTPLAGEHFRAQRVDDGHVVTGRTRAGTASIAGLLSLWETPPHSTVEFTVGNPDALSRQALDDELVLAEIGATLGSLRTSSDRIPDWARALDVSQPQAVNLMGPYALLQQSGSSETVGWVDPTLVIATFPYTSWAQHPTANRYADQQQALIDDPNPDAVRSFFTKQMPRLTRIPGPSGPLYISENGTHRLQFARAVKLPAVWTEIFQPNYSAESLEKLWAMPSWQAHYHRCYGGPEGTATDPFPGLPKGPDPTPRPSNPFARP